MYANSMLPDREDCWWELLIAIINAARRDIDRPTTPEPTKQEAHEFLQWARETFVDDDPRIREG